MCAGVKAAPEFAEYEPELQPSLEAQMIDLVDEIAYNHHDIDDGLDSGLLDQDHLGRSVPLFGEPLEDTSIELVPGYNVVAFKSADELILGDALPIEYVSIWTLDNLTEEWLKNVPGGSPSTNNLTWLVPGNAYCIDVIDGCTWDVGSPGS